MSTSIAGGRLGPLVAGVGAAGLLMGVLSVGLYASEARLEPAALALLASVTSVAVLWLAQRRRQRTPAAVSEAAVSEAAFGLLVEQLPALVWSTDPDLRLTSMTGAGLRQIQDGDATGIGQRLTEFGAHTQELAAALAAHRAALDGHSATYEFTVKERTFDARVEPLRDDDGSITGVIGIALDTTDLQHARDEQARTEAALQQSEARYRSLLRHLPVGVYRSTPEGKLLEANTAMAALLGYPDADALRHVDVHTHFADESERRRLLDAVRTQPTYTTEFALRRANGTTVWVRDRLHATFDAEGRIRYLDGVLTDVTERRRTDERLRWLASFPELDPNPILEVDLAGHVRYLNDAARQRFPDLERDGARHPFLQTLPNLVRALRDAPSAVQDVHLGGAVYEQHASRVPGSDGLRLYVLDITEHAQATRALRESEQKFARAFASAPVALSITTQQDGRYVEVNDRFLALLGLECREQVAAHTAFELGLYADERERARVHALLRSSGGVAPPILSQIYGIQGEARSILVSAATLEVNGEACVLSMILDVTEQRRMEEEVQRLERFYEHMLQEIPIEVAVFDADARYLYLNKAAEAADDLRAWRIGHTDLDFAKARGLDLAPYANRHAWLQDVIARRKQSEFAEVLPTGTGDARHYLRVARPVLDEAGAVRYVVSYGLDVTDRHRSEEELRRAKEQAEELARAKSAFLANMSHEVRTPLTGIIGFATVLAEELEDEQRELASLVKLSGERLLETLNSVLDLARLEANALDVRLVPLDVAEEVAETVQLYQGLATQRGLGLRFSAEAPWPIAYLDAGCLHRAVGNLVGNALKFTETGDVTVRVEQIGSAAGGEVRIHVEDTGVGIAPDFLPHLFDEFRQESSGLDRSHQGSGLGLAITRRLVERMHGRVEVASTKGVGSVFTLAFPLAPPLPAAHDLDD